MQLDRTTVGLAVTAVTKGIEAESSSDCMTTPPDIQETKVTRRSRALPPDLVGRRLVDS